MANTVPTLYPSPDPGRFSPMRKMFSSDAENVLLASNALHSRGGVVLQQNWHPTDQVFWRTSNAYSAAGQCVWRVPQIGVRTNLALVAYVTVPAGGGALRLRSVNTGNLLTVALGAGAQWVTPAGLLTASFGPGYDDIELYALGDGANAIRVEHASVEFAVLGSPIAAPAAGDPVTPFDDAEIDADKPLSSDVAEHLHDNLTDFLARKFRYYSWSGLNDVDTPARGTQTMPPWPHRLWTRPVLGAREASSKAKLWVRARNPGGADAAVYVDHGGGRLAGEPGWRTTITVPAGTVAATWFGADIYLGERAPLEAGGIPYPLASILVYPAGNDGATRGRSAAEIWSVSAWGL